MIQQSLLMEWVFECPIIAGIFLTVTFTTSFNQMNPPKELHGIHFFILVPDMFPHDATANFVRAQARLLESAGHSVTIIAHRRYVQEPHHVISPQELALSPAEQSFLIVHFGIYDACVERVIQLGFHRRIIYFHNITPPLYYQSFQHKKLLSMSWEQLYRILPFFDIRIANSPFTISQVKAYAKPNFPTHKSWFWLPPRINGFSTDNTCASLQIAKKNNYQLCVVGRIASFKNTERAIRIFLSLQEIDDRYHLYVIGRNGENIGSEYVMRVERLIKCSQNIIRLEGIPDQVRNEIVAGSAASLNLSLHEGFCLPVYESLLQYTLPFYGGSQWLSDFLACEEIRVGVSGDDRFDAMRIHRVLTNKTHYQRLLKKVLESSARIDLLSHPFRHLRYLLNGINRE